jgi:hypothetical protein
VTHPPDVLVIRSTRQDFSDGELESLADALAVEIHDPELLHIRCRNAEQLRWPDEPYCPRCGSVEYSYPSLRSRVT